MVDSISLFDGTYAELERSMYLATKKQEVIAHNIANAKTPGYKPLTFNEELDMAVEKQDKQKVVLEEELADLSKNAINYSSYVKMLSSKLNTLRTIAKQGKG